VTSDRIRLGDAILTRVIELQVDSLPVEIFPHTPAEAWREDSEFKPTYWNDDGWRIAMQIWVVEVDGLTVLIDTGAGNDKSRPLMSVLDHLQTDFLQVLARAGFEPGDIDVVVNTHLHFDHVGWNTVHAGDGWAPTFYNARYVISEPDYRYFCPDGPAQTKTPQSPEDEAVQRHVRTVFADSVSPLEGQIEMWSGDNQICRSMWVRPAPGHTPGASVVWLDAGKPAVFVGDLTHCPMQLQRPNDPCAWDENFEEAAATRRQVLTEATRRRAAVIPAHYPGHGGATVVARGDAFMVDDWLEFPSI